jgi:hypothetical protein
VRRRRARHRDRLAGFGTERGEDRSAGGGAVGLLLGGGAVGDGGADGFERLLHVPVSFLRNVDASNWTLLSQCADGGAVAGPRAAFGRCTLREKVQLLAVRIAMTAASNWTFSEAVLSCGSCLSHCS